MSDPDPRPRILASGDTAVVVEFGSTIDPVLSARVLALDAALVRAGLPGVVEAVPTLRSLMVHYDPNVTSHARLGGELLQLADEAARETNVPPPGRRFRLPACYHPDLAPDLADVAAAIGQTTDDVIALHARRPYRVYMIGFLPGHPYMGDTAPALRLPRRKTPRTHVPAGGVAIAIGMTIVYPLESPGGWHLIARTPARLFDLRRDNPILLRPGDEVSFEPIERGEFDRLAAASAGGEWSPAALEAVT